MVGSVHSVVRISKTPFVASRTKIVSQANVLITAAWHVQAPTNRTAYVEGAGENALKMTIKQYGVADKEPPYCLILILKAFPSPP